jgi:predicted peptidase
LALAQPHTFAALAPVCGGIVPNGSATSVRQSPLNADASDPYELTAKRLRHIPVWMFHGADGHVIFPSESRKMRDALRAVGGDVRYTEYAGVGHNAREKAYREADLWTWLFAQKLSDASKEPLHQWRTDNPVCPAFTVPRGHGQARLPVLHGHR